MSQFTAEHVALGEDVYFQSLGASHDGVLLSMQTGQLYRCNPTATEFLAAVQTGKSCRESTSVVVDAFDVSEEEAATDLNDLVNHLIAQQLLELVA